MQTILKAFALGVTSLVFAAALPSGSADAWATKQKAYSKCGPNDTAVIHWSFTNTEPTNTHQNWSMTVKVTDSQTGATDTQVADEGQTISGVFDTGLSEIDAGSIDYYLTWTDGRSGVDSRVAYYEAVANCKPIPKCEHNPDLDADDPKCQPVCEHNDDLLANDPNCKEVCIHNDDLFVDDENCKEVCEYDDQIFADHEDCGPEVCVHNANLLAEDPNCKELCEHDGELFADDDDCKPTVTVVEPKVTELPRTGAGSVAFLATAIATSAGGAHAVVSRFRK